jgi:hypothetical protein
MFEYSPSWKHFTQLKIKFRHFYNYDDHDDGMTRGRELIEHHTAYYRLAQSVAQKQRASRGTAYVACGHIRNEKMPFSSFSGKANIDSGSNLENL